MLRDTITRRSFLASASGIALASIASARPVARAASSISKDTFTIMDGTEQETRVHVRTATTTDPTVMVVGGIHGNEEAGYIAADKIVEADIDSGRLVVIPRANEVAIQQDTRFGEDGVDLNRQFPVGEEPQTELARAIWDVVLEYEPDVVIDLHESRSYYEGDNIDGVGQALFHSWGDRAREDAEDAADYVNNHYVSDSTYNFTIGNFSGPDQDPDGLLVHKAARDAGAIGFLPETLSTSSELDTRVQWHRQLTRQLAEEELFPEPSSEGDESDGTDAAENKAPTAVIQTTPENATEINFEKAATVDLDASNSSDPDGEISSYEWDLDGDGTFEATGETAAVTLSFCGELPVTLRVTDDDGATDIEQITLSTV